MLQTRRADSRTPEKSVVTVRTAISLACLGFCNKESRVLLHPRLYCAMILVTILWRKRSQHLINNKTNSYIAIVIVIGAVVTCVKRKEKENAALDIGLVRYLWYNVEVHRMAPTLLQRGVTLQTQKNVLSLNVLHRAVTHRAINILLGRYSSVE